MNCFIGNFYDGVYLLGLVLNETLTEGKDITDGVNLTRKMWNRDFHGKVVFFIHCSSMTVLTVYLYELTGRRVTLN